MTPDEVDADLDRRLADAVERLGNGMRSLAQQSAKVRGLSALQQQIVLALARHPAQRREVNALAAEFAITMPTVSDAVTALERKQLLTRSRGPDGRRRLLTLTDQGEEVARELASWDVPLLTAVRKLSVDDQATTLRNLLRLIGELRGDG